MDISLIDVTVAYQRVITSTLFLDFHLCVPSLKNNQLQIVPMAERHSLEWQILLSFTGLSPVSSHGLSSVCTHSWDDFLF